jgi:polar amino acid transport system permease protein
VSAGPTTTQGAGTARLSAYSGAVPRGATFQLLAAWALLGEGALGLFFGPIIIYSTKTNIDPGRIALYVAGSLLCLASGGLLYSRWTWTWWLAIGTAIGVAAWFTASGGLTSKTEGYVASAISGLVVVFLLLGRRAAGRSEAMSIASANIPFRAKVAVVWLSIFLAIAVVLALFQLDTEWIRENFSYIATGVVFTILLAANAIVLALILALFGALGRLSKNPVAYAISGFYTSFFRGTPLIVQLFLIFFALPQIGGNLHRISLVNILALTTFQAGVIGLGLNYGAYMTEIFRAGIQSVGHGQGEAAEALGMSYPQRMRRVVLPQATRVIIPPTGNEFIAMMKDTALVSFLGVELSKAELFRRAQLVGNQDLRKLEALLVAAAMYWTLTAIFTHFQRRLERRMGRGYERGGSTTKAKPHLLQGSAAGGPGGGAMVVEVPGPPAQPGVPQGPPV